MSDKRHRELLLRHIKPVSAAATEPIELTPRQRHDVVDAFVRLLEGMYAHLPHKRASYGLDPVQRLRLLGERVSDVQLTDAAFHREMAQIFTGLRDAHTRYLTPQPNRNLAYFLPILIERYIGDADRTRYIASQVMGPTEEHERLFERAGFAKGAEILHWNGRPIGRAIDLYADDETGGRPDARIARALESLTIRPLRYALPPDEEWVDIGFRRGDDEGELRLEWQIVEMADEPEPPAGSARQALAFNPTADSARQVKKMLFARAAWIAESEQAEARTKARRRRTATEAARQAMATADRRSAVTIAAENWDDRGDKPLMGKFASSAYARVHELDDDRYGYLRIHSFQVNHAQAFIREIRDMLNHLPRNGLIIDLRGNPGGNIWAAEGMLQLLTPHRIEPTRFTMLATDMTRAMAQVPQNRSLRPWADSLRTALATGVSHSRSEPLTPISQCNNLGQLYPGPVVAIVDANTYSAGDLFAAGFVDNGVGKLICTDRATGGGGANVWMPNTVATALTGTGYELPDLGGVSFTISARRAERIGAEGQELEDAGVASVFRHRLTKRDLLEGNRELLDYACRHLRNEVRSGLRYDIVRDDGTVDRLVVRCSGLTRLSIDYDGVTHATRDLRVGGTSGDHVAADQPYSLALDADWTQHRVELLGYDNITLRQRRLIVPPQNQMV